MLYFVKSKGESMKLLSKLIALSLIGTFITGCVVVHPNHNKHNSSKYKKVIKPKSNSNASRYQ